MPRKIVISLLLLVLLIISSSCGTSPRQPVGQQAEPTGQQTEPTVVSVQLFFLPTVEFSSLWVADYKGYYADENIRLVYQPWGEGVDVLKQVVGTQSGIQLGFQDGASIIIGRAAGMPIKAIWAGTQRSPFAFLTRPGSGVKTVADFKGRRIGYRPHELYVLESVLAHEGMSLKDVTPISLSRDATPLLKGDVDAFLAYVNNTPVALKLQGISVDTIMASDYGFEFYGDVLFTTEETIKNHSDVLERFVRATTRGWRYALEHPDEVAPVVVERYYKDGKVEHQKLQLAAFRSLVTATGDYSDLGRMTSEQWKRSIEIAYNQQLIRKNLQAEEVFDSQFVK
jgi:ABC-type nitrate/sulfonate/bicarbonate transport system substrate-binding protein